MKRKTAIEEAIDFLAEINVEGYGVTRLITRARTDLRALMALADAEDRFQGATSTRELAASGKAIYKAVARLRRLGLLPPVKP